MSNNLRHRYCWLDWTAIVTGGEEIEQGVCAYAQDGVCCTMVSLGKLCVLRVRGVNTYEEAFVRTGREFTSVGADSRGMMMLLLRALPVTGLLGSWPGLGPRVSNWVSRMLATDTFANLSSTLSRLQ